MKMHPPVGKMLAFAAIVIGGLTAATPASAGYVGTVFYILLENHNFTQPSTDTTAPQQLLNNPAAPYLNSLVTPGNPNAAQTSYASAYYNVLATASGNNPAIHPSEPNYIWQEAGTSFNNPPAVIGGGSGTDADPYKAVAPFAPNVYSAPSLSGLLQTYGKTWKAYVEDAQLAKDAGGNLTSTPVAPGQYTTPLNSLSGTSPSYVNAYNGSNQYNLAPKHVGQDFFALTNGGTTTAPNLGTASNGNPEAAHYAPLQRLATDLANNTVSQYNVITPNQYNDMHSALTGGFTYNGVHYTGDQAGVAQGDNFLATVVPQIMASQAYKNNGAIVIWNDETEGTNANDFSHTSTEIVISPLAKGNAYNSTLNYTHSSDIKTLQELFAVEAPGGGFLGDAATAGTNDLSDLFVAGAIPTTLVPEPSSYVMMGLGLAIAAGYRRRMARKTA